MDPADTVGTQEHGLGTFRMITGLVSAYPGCDRQQKRQALELASNGLASDPWLLPRVPGLYEELRTALNKLPAKLQLAHLPRSLLPQLQPAKPQPRLQPVMPKPQLQPAKPKPRPANSQPQTQPRTANSQPQTQPRPAAPQPPSPQPASPARQRDPWWGSRLAIFPGSRGGRGGGRGSQRQLLSLHATDP
ncbi:hypothetical protein L3Q82_009097 [Scortum barcoo]|uniref:Uncharacterized protein n=1 Tax=Scortum barcoo TaxID=214431 RepID=A0ACB8XBE1_9TELE|nr:hypothetical protein L3Q82_009097 [Scortum barcoo]